MRFTVWTTALRLFEQKRYAGSEGEQMRTSSVTVFCKQATCPSSKTLLSYHSLETAFEQAQWITYHLESCEFCAAEFRLLAKHEALEEEYPLTEIPAHLRSLAEALLGKIELSGLISLSETSYEKERLTLTDA
jgi:hypothetical protein